MSKANTRKFKGWVLRQMLQVLFLVDPDNPNKPKGLGYRPNDNTTVFTLVRYGRKVIIDAPNAPHGEKRIVIPSSTIVMGFSQDMEGKRLSIVMDQEQVKYDHRLQPVSG